MTIWGWLVISVGSIFLVTSLIRMAQYSALHGLKTNRCNTQLLIVGYATGLSYVIGNQGIQQILHSYVSFLPIPIVPIIWLICAIIFISYLYLYTVHTYTTLSVAKWIMRFLIIATACGIAFIIAIYNKVSFFDLQVISFLISSLVGIVSTAYLSSLMRGVLQAEEKSIHRNQFRWFMLEITALSLATLFLMVDSVYKLWADNTIIYTPTYILSVVLQTISIIALHILNEGNFSHLVEYPSKLRIYFKLKKLYDYIQQYVKYPDAYDIPIPDTPSPANIDLLTYHTVIMISDRYWLLKEDIILREKMDTIFHADISLNTTISELTALVWSCVRY